jgi:hypothetical protein
MRPSTLRAATLAGLLSISSISSAQVTESERAAARDLFRQGDELQRAAHFAEALDKFQRAQQLYSAPTNQLRIAQCQTQLGQWVESAETYRSVVRSPLSPDSPSAFRTAVDQARLELDALEPRIPKLVVQIQPAVADPRLELDGQPVPAVLLGQAMPLDPGSHRVTVDAAGYATAEQGAVLKEREARVVVLSLKPVATAATSPRPSAGAPVAPAAAPERAPAVDTSSPERESRVGLLIGGHVGLELVAGALPPDSGTTDSGSVNVPTVAGSGIAFGFDGGVRFARRWYVGLALEHAVFSSTATSQGADATLLGAVVGFVLNPDRVSFYGEAGLGGRWFHYTLRGVPGSVLDDGIDGSLAAGVWIPIGRSLRLVPKASLTFGAFDTEASSTSTSSYGHAFFMLGVSGFYNVDF